MNSASIAVWNRKAMARTVRDRKTVHCSHSNASYIGRLIITVWIGKSTTRRWPNALKETPLTADPWDGYPIFGISNSVGSPCYEKLSGQLTPPSEWHGSCVSVAADAK
jgi:hypothetical protein